MCNRSVGNLAAMFPAMKNESIGGNNNFKVFCATKNYDIIGGKFLSGNCHYGKRSVCRVSGLLPCANFRAHGKLNLSRVSNQKHLVKYLPCA